MILVRIQAIRRLQSELPCYDPSLLCPLEPSTLQLLRVLVVPVINSTRRGLLVGELEAEDLRVLIGLNQRLPTLSAVVCLFKFHQITFH